jgi:two-component system, LuxR family, response regulator FixJ
MLKFMSRILEINSNFEYITIYYLSLSLGFPMTSLTCLATLAEPPRDGLMSLEAHTVFVIDPDPSTAAIANSLLKGYQLRVQGYTHGREFFAVYDGTQPGCLVLEQRIVDMSGLQIQRRLTSQAHCLPMVYVVSDIDVFTAVLLMRGGAVHILEKPLRSIELLGAIQEALTLGQKQRRRGSQREYLRQSITMLTHKERQLLSHVAAAESTKMISKELAISPRAVELRRRSVMAKLDLGSPMEVLRFAVLAVKEFDSIPDDLSAEADADS